MNLLNCTPRPFTFLFSFIFRQKKNIFLWYRRLYFIASLCYCAFFSLNVFITLVTHTHHVFSCEYAKYLYQFIKSFTRLVDRSVVFFTRISFLVKFIWSEEKHKEKALWQRMNFVKISKEEFFLSKKPVMFVEWRDGGWWLNQKH